MEADRRGFALVGTRPGHADDHGRICGQRQGFAMPRLDRRGRSRYDAKHVRLYDYMTACEAYLSLCCQARAVLIESVRLYDGTNNGRIGLSVRTAAQRCRIAQGTASRAFRELTDRGFIECTKPGGFNRKFRHATEWRITWKSCDVSGALPSKQFMQWRREKQNTVSKYNATVPSFDTVPGIANSGGR
jgi:hypothetical protein